MFFVEYIISKEIKVFVKILVAILSHIGGEEKSKVFFIEVNLFPVDKVRSLKLINIDSIFYICSNSKLVKK